MWAKQNTEFFGQLSSAKETEIMLKELKESLSGSQFGKKQSGSNAKWEQSLSKWKVILELFQFLTSEAFGLIITDIFHEEKTFQRSFIGLELINWIHEILDLETRGKKRNSLIFINFFFLVLKILLIFLKIHFFQFLLLTNFFFSFYKTLLKMSPSYF